MEKHQSKTSLNYRIIGLFILVFSTQFIFCKCQQKQIENKPVEEVKTEIAIKSQDEYEGLKKYAMTLDEEAQYIKEINASRTEKDRLFRSKETPVAQEILNLFSKLNYFAPDKNFIVNSVLKEFKDQDTVELLTSKGTIRKMIRAGEFLFKINGTRQKLTAYFAIDRTRNSFFVPFLDKTNRASTYKGGRYLDIDRKDVNDDVIGYSVIDYYVIDFNQAYNPYCVYSDKYSCPIVPEENTITEQILAGEKDFVITLKM